MSLDDTTDAAAETDMKKIFSLKGSAERVEAFFALSPDRRRAVDKQMAKVLNEINRKLPPETLAEYDERLYRILGFREFPVVEDDPQ